MERVAVLTPSYRGDADLFADLHRSVLTHMAHDVVHHVVVPPSDAGLFRQYEGERCRILTHRDLLPRRYLTVPWASGLAINLRRRWPPVRGWVVQQIMKLAAAAVLDARAILIIDSDAMLLRPTTADSFIQNGTLSVYRKENGITADMSRHMLWNRVARRMLGLPPSVVPPLPDYVNPVNVWDPMIVRELQDRIEVSTGTNWVDAVSGELHVSEFVLYGVFVDNVLGGAVPLSGTLCHNYYERVPLDSAGAADFAAAMPPDALAVMVSSHSKTPPEVRQEVLKRCLAMAGAGPAEGT